MTLGVGECIDQSPHRIDADREDAHPGLNDTKICCPAGPGIIDEQVAAGIVQLPFYFFGLLARFCAKVYTAVRCDGRLRVDLGLRIRTGVSFSGSRGHFREVLEPIRCGPVGQEVRVASVDGCSDVDPPVVAGLNRGIGASRVKFLGDIDHGRRERGDHC